MTIEQERLTPTQEDRDAFQARVQPWLMACFGAEIAGDREERNHRFLEEALELVQSCGCTASEAHQLVDFVYGRPVGELHQEIGGVMVTLAALCLANDADMHAAGWVELDRVWGKVEAIRAKQAAKPKRSPLPALKSPPIAGGEGDLSPTMTLRDAHAMQFEALLDDVPETWARVGYKSEAEEIADMANVGRALMEALPVGYHYSDCPSEIVADLQNQITAQPAEECVGGVGVSPEAARSSARKVNEWISRALDGTTSNDVSRMVETLQLSARTAFDGGVVIEPVILTEAATLLTQIEARGQALREALETAESALDQLLDDMGETGQCVCPAAKFEAIDALADVRRALLTGAGS